jgi:hypothetical protein
VPGFRSGVLEKLRIVRRLADRAPRDRRDEDVALLLEIERVVERFGPAREVGKPIPSRPISSSSSTPRAFSTLSTPARLRSCVSPSRSFGLEKSDGVRLSASKSACPPSRGR